jgi:hypothetical protein
VILAGLERRESLAILHIDPEVVIMFREGREKLLLWAPFALTSLLSLLIQVWPDWAFGYPTRPVLTYLALANFMLGARIVIHTGLRRLTVLLVVVGLLVGQWWIVVDFIYIIGWRIVGFAP